MLAEHMGGVAEFLLIECSSCIHSNNLGFFTQFYANERIIRSRDAISIGAHAMDDKFTAKMGHEADALS